MINRPFFTLFFLCISTLSYAKMYKCKVDGKTIYSQTECTGDITIFKSFDSDKYHQDTIQQHQLNESQSIANASREELDTKYEKEQEKIKMKIQDINLDLNQSVEQLVTNKTLKQQLEKELQDLKIDYQKRIDPREVTQKEIMTELRGLRAEIKKIRGK